MLGVVVHSVYKPPNDQFELTALGHRNLPHIVIRDFKSHSTTWEYNTTDDNGKSVEEWAILCDFTLIQYAKLPKSFNSAAREKATTRTSYLHLNASPIRVRSQSWTRSRTPFRRRFNLRKADWIGYATELDKLITDVEPTPANYNCFVESVRMASRRHIPRGCRTKFISGLTEESKSLYEAYKTQYSNSPFDNGTMESGNALLDSIIKEKKRRWEEVINKHDSHQSSGVENNQNSFQ